MKIRTVIAGSVLITIVIVAFLFLGREQRSIVSVRAAVSSESGKDVRAPSANVQFVQRLARTQHVDLQRLVDIQPSSLAGAEWVLGGAMRFNLNLLRANNMNISDDEINLIADRYVVLQNVRGSFELSIAEVTQDADGIYVSIPPYPEAGELLKEKLRQDIVDVVGEPRAAEIWGKIEPKIANAFGQFGVANQKVRAFLREMPNGQREYVFKRTEMWMAPEGMSEQSSTAWFTPESIKDTDYLFLAPLLGRLKPRHGE